MPKDRIRIIIPRQKKVNTVAQTPTVERKMGWSEWLILLISFATLVVAYQTCNLGATVHEQQTQITQLESANRELVKLNKTEVRVDTTIRAELGELISLNLRSAYDSADQNAKDSFKFIEFRSTLYSDFEALLKNSPYGIPKYRKNVSEYAPILRDSLMNINQLVFNVAGSYNHYLLSHSVLDKSIQELNEVTYHYCVVLQTDHMHTWSYYLQILNCLNKFRELIFKPSNTKLKWTLRFVDSTYRSPLIPDSVLFYREENR